MLLEAAGRSNAPCKGKNETPAVAQQNRKLCNQHKHLPLCASIVLCRKAYQSNTSSLSRSSCTYVGVLVPAGIWAKVAKASAALCGGSGSLTQKPTWDSGTWELSHTFARGRDSRQGHPRQLVPGVFLGKYGLVNARGVRFFPPSNFRKVCAAGTQLRNCGVLTAWAGGRGTASVAGRESSCSRSPGQQVGHSTRQCQHNVGVKRWLDSKSGRCFSIWKDQSILCAEVTKKQAEKLR